MEKQGLHSRRRFLKKSVAGTMMTAVSPMIIAEETIKKPVVIPASAKGANDRLRIAIIGVHGRGGSQIQQIMEVSNQSNVEIVALCDPDLEVLKDRSDEFESKYGKKVETLQDFRRALDDKRIDAVTIATPNHWHALMTIWACQAGKDVYVEKPGTHNVHEGRKIIEAAYKYNRIVQHGVQLRSSIAIREAVKHLEEGLIGRVYMSRGLVFRWRPDIGIKGISKVPDTLNYDLWTGPAPMAPFSRDLVHYNWHWH